MQKGLSVYLTSRYVS